MTEEIPDKASGRLEIPVSVIVYDHQTDHRFFILIKLSELDCDVLALACMDGCSVLKCESEGRINIEIKIAGHRHSIDSLIDTPHIEVRIAFPVVVNGNQKCSDFGNSECSIFGIKTTVLLASAVQ